MNAVQSLFETTVSARIARATVVSVQAEGIVLVTATGNTEALIPCEVLQVAEPFSLALAPADIVLVWLPDEQEKRAVILGRLGPSHAVAEAAKPVPEEIVLEAKTQLSLQCGESSITLRQDGKVLIKGKDVVSRAKRMNRIKGGAVAIN